MTTIISRPATPQCPCAINQNFDFCCDNNQATTCLLDQFVPFDVESKLEPSCSALYPSSPVADIPIIKAGPVPAVQPTTKRPCSPSPIDEEQAVKKLFRDFIDESAVSDQVSQPMVPLPSHLTLDWTCLQTELAKLHANENEINSFQEEENNTNNEWSMNLSYEDISRELDMAFKAICNVRSFTTLVQPTKQQRNEKSDSMMVSPGAIPNIRPIHTVHSKQTISPKRDRSNHVKVKSNRNQRCTKCSVVFYDIAQLHEHRRQVHPELVCQRCGQTFSRFDSLKRHHDFAKLQYGGLCRAKTGRLSMEERMVLLGDRSL
jgi:hypothetical protein